MLSTILLSDLTENRHDRTLLIRLCLQGHMILSSDFKQTNEKENCHVSPATVTCVRAEGFVGGSPYSLLGPLSLSSHETESYTGRRLWKVTSRRIYRRVKPAIHSHHSLAPVGKVTLA